MTAWLSSLQGVKLLDWLELTALEFSLWGMRALAELASGLLPLSEVGNFSADLQKKCRLVPLAF